MILAIFIMAMVVIASAWGLFFLADRQGMFTARVRVMGNVGGFNATQCFLYIDGVKSGTQYLDYGPPPLDTDYYYGYDFQFYVDVAANAEHEFTVTTSDGKGSNSETLYIPYGQNTNVFLDIYGETTQITVRGNYAGDNLNPYVDFYLDGIMTDTEYGQYPGHLEYVFTESVYCNQSHVLMVQTHYYTEGSLNNQTTIYVGSDPVTVYLDLAAFPVEQEVKQVNVNILGCYSGKDGSFQVDCYVDDVYVDHDYVINPGYTDYSFSVEVNESQGHDFKLVLKDDTHQFLASNQSYISVGNASITIYIDLQGPETVLVTIKGNYTGNYTECRVYLYADGEESWLGIINPGATSFSFVFEVYTCAYHNFALQVKDLEGNYVCGYLLYPYIGTEPYTTLYQDLNENDF
ncbi:MAG: hypothetical protein R6W91_03745 [Thermoplasmata archaeon]